MSEEFKYIAVRNWAQYQGRISKQGDARRPFIKMSASLDSDSDYSQLTFFERQVLDGCRRLIGLHGQNLLNDPAYISRGLCAARKDRPHVPHAVRTLTLRGFLILTNQRDPFSEEPKDKRREEKKREDKKTRMILAERVDRKIKTSLLPVILLTPCSNRQKEIPPAVPLGRRVFQIEED